jgi:LacI family transcriptional regulator
MAAGAYSILREEGIAVPETVSLSSFGCHLDADILMAPLQIAVQDVTRLGRQAAELLLQRIAEPDFLRRQPVRQILPVRLP